MEGLRTFGRFLALTMKRLYDLLASYLLFWTLYFASVAVVLHVGFELVATELDSSPEVWWEAIAEFVSVSPDTARLGAFLLLHLLVFVLTRRPIAKIQPYFEAGFHKVAGFFDKVTSDRIRLRLAGEAAFSIVVTALLVPFILQPTLVPEVEGVDAWAERGANLADGTASIALMESVIGLYRLGFADPVVVTQRGVTADELERADDDAIVESESVSWEIFGPPSGAWETAQQMRYEEVEVVVPAPRRPQPVMDRWDETIMQAVGGDEDRFAYVKAFMYVESAGRQYAVSRTGCAGLMQFCSGTARSHPFKRVFGTGQVYTCKCRNGCSIDRDVRVALESGERDRVEAQAASFPCQLTDARFDPEKAIRAGAVYVDNLHRDFGGNIQIMYIGYNSGPAVANRVWRGVGENPDATLSEIEAVLPASLKPYYGKSAGVRSRSLVGVHLPKIERAYQRYAPVQTVASTASTGL